MRRSLGLCLAAFVALCGVGITQAKTPASVERTCPIGGEKIQSPVGTSDTHFESRPDGRPYGPNPLVPAAECPGNGFVVFDDQFTEAELTLMAAIVSSTEYQAMRKNETQHYRAWWLLEHSGRTDPARAAQVLLVASWETDEAPERKARYQKLFAGAAAAVERSPANADEWFWLNLRGANAARELGRFDIATERLDKIDRDQLLPRDDRQRKSARHLIDGLRALIKERNTASEPLHLIPIGVAASHCLDGKAEPSERAKCADPKLAAATRRLNDRRARSAGNSR
jgi:hypothetical protein